MTAASPTIEVRKRVWPLVEPFAVTNHTWHEIELAYVQATLPGVRGHAEGSPLFYRNETADDLVAAIERLLHTEPEALSRDGLAHLPLPSGARNAIDCALWDLECKSGGCRIGELTGIGPPQPLQTVVTVPLDEPGRMLARAERYSRCPVLKIKLDGDGPAERLAAVRRGAPAARLVVDANCAWTIDELADLEAALAGSGVEMVEQPLSPEDDAALEGYRPPYKLCADESCQTVESLNDVVGRYDMINIKLDKSGGLTQSLALAKEAQRLGLELMVGNMLGSSLAMAPAWHLGLLCTYVDVDGPVYLARDCEHALIIRDGVAAPPAPELWG